MKSGGAPCLCNPSVHPSRYSAKSVRSKCLLGSEARYPMSKCNNNIHAVSGYSLFINPSFYGVQLRRPAVTMLKNIIHRLRALIALALLRAIFSQGMSGARAVILLPLRVSAQQAMADQCLVGLLRAPQIVIDPAHPSLRGLDLLSLLGSQSIRIPKQPPFHRSQSAQP